MQRPQFRSERTSHITESVIREMSRIAARHGALNLAQGFPDFAAPQVLKEAAATAIFGDINQYAITWGAKSLRDALASKYDRHYGLTIEPETEMTVVCGSTEGMMASLLAVTNPGDEIIIFEPFYENYGPDTLLAGAERRFVRLRPPDWTFDPDELRRAFSARTKAIIINTPNNPTGKVFSRDELEFIADLCQQYDVLAITDEIYEHITYGDSTHVPMMLIPGMRNRTILINSLSKTYSVTGWRVGWVLASPDLTASIRKVHDFLTVGAAAPLQQAAAAALALPDQYYRDLAASYQHKRDLMMEVLQEAGFESLAPQGAYYIMADISPFGFDNDVEFVRALSTTVGVAAVPGSSFFSKPADGARFIRFCFCKKEETLLQAQKLFTEGMSELKPAPAFSAPGTNGVARI